ncbi:hypothetical protein AVEN_147428-1 [Araneus ventricosus]|uniref:Uncharacterized protein n=1 Tax=Araneus ventricosus TaxID=182803 RepID=A0A4Y2DQ10_ARAVE|nr:hypothetical protein AVEN_147428-1 [Araneus ventricosus]
MGSSNDSSTFGLNQPSSIMEWNISYAYLFCLIHHILGATEVLPHLNFKTTAAIVIKVVSECSKATMHYAMRHLTTPPRGKIRNQLSYLKKRNDIGKKVNYKVVEHH